MTTLIPLAGSGGAGAGLGSVTSCDFLILPYMYKNTSKYSNKITTLIPLDGSGGAGAGLGSVTSCDFLILPYKNTLSS